MNHHRSLTLLAAATLLACRAGGAPQAPAAEKPTPAAPPKAAAAAPAPAVAVATAAAPGDLAGALARLRDGMAAMEAAALVEAQRLLAETLAAVAAHQAAQLEARIARLERKGG